MISARIGIATAALLAAASQGVHGQPFTMHPTPDARASLQIQLLHDFLTSDYSSYQNLGILNVRAELPVSRRICLEAILPINVGSTYGGLSIFERPATNEVRLGNAYVGIEALLDTLGRSALSFGVGLPTGASDLYYLNALTDFLHAERVVPYVLSLYANYQGRILWHSGVFLGLEVGPHLWRYTGPEQLPVATFTFAHFGIAGGYESGSVVLLGEFAGEYDLTSYPGSRDVDRSFSTLGFGVAYKAPHVWPQVFVEVPLEHHVSDVVAVTLGVGLRIAL